MKVVLAARVEADIASQFQYGIDHFGRVAAERTFARVDRFLVEFLPAHPYSGGYVPDHDIYEVWIARTPFVIFYRVNDETDTITVVGFFHRARDRAGFDPGD